MQVLYGIVTCVATCPKSVGAHRLSSQLRAGTQRRSPCHLESIPGLKSRQSQALKLGMSPTETANHGRLLEAGADITIPNRQGKLVQEVPLGVDCVCNEECGGARGT